IAQSRRSGIAVCASTEDTGDQRGERVSTGSGTPRSNVIAPWCDPVNPILPAVIRPYSACSLINTLADGVIGIFQQLHRNVDERLAVGISSTSANVSSRIECDRNILYALPWAQRDRYSRCPRIVARKPAERSHYLEYAMCKSLHQDFGK